MLTSARSYHTRYHLHNHPQHHKLAPLTHLHKQMDMHSHTADPHSTPSLHTNTLHSYSQHPSQNAHSPTTSMDHDWKSGARLGEAQKPGPVTSDVKGRKTGVHAQRPTTDVHRGRHWTPHQQVTRLHPLEGCINAGTVPTMMHGPLSQHAHSTQPVNNRARATNGQHQHQICAVLPPNHRYPPRSYPNPI